MKELVVISGKGGTGKTSVLASFAALAKNAVLADCDVDAADLHLVTAPQVCQKTDFYSGHQAVIRSRDCIGCGACLAHCRFGAVIHQRMDDPWLESHGGQIVCQDCDFCERSCSVQANRAIQAMQEACGKTAEMSFQIDPLICEGCGVCERFCPVKTIDFIPRLCGQWYVSDTRFGPMVHAKLGIAAENSGKLVSTVRQNARLIAEERNLDLILVDGPPGIGCPVIASITGASAVLAVTEPTQSAFHDLERVIALARHFAVPALVCVNKYDINPDLTLEIESKAQDLGSVLVGRIRYDSSVTEAQIQGKTVAEFVDSPARHDIKHIWEKTYSLLMQTTCKT